ncbi:MAG: hypothetical protein QOJ63_24 [Solirubrobacteraceae bacterium]|nr:hypothetical protein [Solirubrobacteraceae bacterium]
MREIPDLGPWSGSATAARALVRQPDNDTSAPTAMAS